MYSIKAKRFLKEINQLSGRFEGILVFVTSGVLVVLTSMIVLDVCLRFLFNSPLAASVESTELMMPYIVFCPLAYTLTKGGHVRISLILDRTSPRVSTVLNGVSQIIAFLLCGMLSYTGWHLFWESFVIREEMLAIVKLPWYVGKFAMPVGFFFLAVRYFLNVISALSAKSTSSGSG